MKKNGIFTAKSKTGKGEEAKKEAKKDSRACAISGKTTGGWSRICILQIRSLRGARDWSENPAGFA
ncbi:MAG: hypothetical protein LBK13_12130 [Spirochaetales bacterium]|jgi:hypothetical protein|nr:hypothetical protein [Spirochaetales bacterium]